METASTICPRRMSMLAEMARATHAPLRPQVVHQLFFQRSPCLNEQAAINGLVRHAHALVIGIVGPSAIRKSARATNPGPVYSQPSLATRGSWPADTSSGARPRPKLGDSRHERDRQAATMARDLSAHRRGGTTQTTGNLANRRAGSDPSRDVFSLSESER